MAFSKWFPQARGHLVLHTKQDQFQREPSPTSSEYSLSLRWPHIHSKHLTGSEQVPQEGVTSACGLELRAVRPSGLQRHFYVSFNCPEEFRWRPGRTGGEVGPRGDFWSKWPICRQDSISSANICPSSVLGSPCSTSSPCPTARLRGHKPQPPTCPRVCGLTGPPHARKWVCFSPANLSCVRLSVREAKEPGRREESFLPSPRRRCRSPAAPSIPEAL